VLGSVGARVAGSWGETLGEGEAGIGDEGMRGEGRGVMGGVAVCGSIFGIEAEFNAGCRAQDVSRISTSAVKLMDRIRIIGQ
jgi:hypothetical protein